MGYCIDMVGSDFKVYAENFDSLMAEVRHLMNYAFTKGNSTSGFLGETIRSYSWVETDRVLKAIDQKNLSGMFQEWGYSITQDMRDNSITSISLDNEKLGQEKLFFQAIAPYVVNGSYIGMKGEDGENWMWLFDNGKLLTSTIQPDLKKQIAIVKKDMQERSRISAERFKRVADMTLMLDEIEKEVPPIPPKLQGRKFYLDD